MNKNPSISKTYNAPRKFVNRIGRHHFAHLRALAEGVEVKKSAFLYLGIEHGLQARPASQQTIDAVRAIARRSNERSARLIGLTIKTDPLANQMSLDDFIAARGLDDWSESDVMEMYKEAFPQDPSYEKRVAMREKIIALLKRIEALSVETPKLSDMVTGWFDDSTAERFVKAGVVNLGDLHKTISIGGRWYENMPGIGKSKAKRIEGHLALILEGVVPSPNEEVNRSALTYYTLGNFDKILKAFHEKIKSGELKEPDQATQENPSSDTSLTVVAPGIDNTGLVTTIHVQTKKTPSALLPATNDVEASIWWVTVKTGSKTTALVYLREAIRLMLWLKYERRGKQFSDMDITDCYAYLTFLQNIPTRWLSKQHKAPFTLGWAPFKDQLKEDSYKNTIVIVCALFNFLDRTKYLEDNPWVLVNKKMSQSRRLNRIDSKAITSKAMRMILDYLLIQPPCPELSRFKFILIFLSKVGLRSAELLSVKLQDFRLEVDGWELKVMGKGKKERLVAVPDAAMDAVKEYLTTRNIPIGEISISDKPLIGKLKSRKKTASDGKDTHLGKSEPDLPELTIGYQALYKFMRVWFKRIANAATLPEYDQKKLYAASTHWLRHTFGTIAVELEVPYDVIQSQLGHSSIDTVVQVYARASNKRLKSEIAKAFN